MFLHCGGHGVLGSSFLLAWLAEELSRRNKIVILIIVPDGCLEALSCLVEESTGGRGLARFKLKTWQCDELSARRSIGVRVQSGQFNTSGQGHRQFGVEGARLSGNSWQILQTQQAYNLP